MQNSDVLLFPSICFVRPSVGSLCFRMTVQFKNFYDAFPDRFPLKRLLDGHALNVARLNAMQMPDDVL